MTMTTKKDDCMKPIHFKDIDYISPASSTSWMEIDVKSKDECYYRMNIHAFSNVIEHVIKTGSLDATMNAEKKPREHNTYLTFPPS